MIPLDKIRHPKKHDTLEKEASLRKCDSKLLPKNQKNVNLENIIAIAREYLKFENEKKDLVNILKISQWQRYCWFSSKRFKWLDWKKEKYENELKVFLLQRYEDDNKNAIVELELGLED